MREKGEGKREREREGGGEERERERKREREYVPCMLSVETIIILYFPTLSFSFP